MSDVRIGPLVLGHPVPDELRRDYRPGTVFLLDGSAYSVGVNWVLRPGRALRSGWARRFSDRHDVEQYHKPDAYKPAGGMK